jgi:hypothetical protein
MSVTIDPRVNFGTPAATLNYRIVDAGDSQVVARTSTDVAEYPAGSGLYHVSNGILVDAVMGQTIIWDDGTSHSTETLDHYINDVLTGQRLLALISDVGTVLTAVSGVSTSLSDRFDSVDSDLAGLTNLVNANSDLLTTIYQAEVDGFTNLGTDISVMGAKVTSIKVITDELDTMIVSGVFTEEALANAGSGSSGDTEIEEGGTVIIRTR